MDDECHRDPIGEEHHDQKEVTDDQPEDEPLAVVVGRLVEDVYQLQDVVK